jgi:iron only hydrogenase large subunit-like protein
VTTAETVLLEQQSTDEVLARLRDAHTRVVVSIAPQPLAALAAHFAADFVEVCTAPETQPT